MPKPNFPIIAGWFAFGLGYITARVADPRGAFQWTVYIAIAIAASGIFGCLIDAFAKHVRREQSREIAEWLRHVQRLDEVPGASDSMPEFNPLWDASVLVERKFDT